MDDKNDVSRGICAARGGVLREPFRGARFTGYSTPIMIDSGALNDPTAWLKKDANSNLAHTSTGAIIPRTNDARARTQLQYALGRSSTDRNYDGYYRSFNTSSTINDFLLACFGYAKTIGRINRAFITPGVTFSSATANPQTATINNTGLLP